MKWIECTNQAEVNAAVKKGDGAVVRSGEVTATGSAQVTASGSAQVRAYDSAQVTATGSAQVRAYDSAQVTATGSAQVTAYGSAQVRAYGSAQVRATGSAQVRAYDSAQVRAYDSAQVTATGSAQVTAYGSAQVRAYGSAQVRAYGSAQVRAYGSAQVTATKFVAITVYGNRVKVIEGTQIIKVPALDDITDWLDYYGIKAVRGYVTLYKALDDDLKSGYGLAYPVGEKVTAEDFKPTNKCGAGLHLCPRPIIALRYNHKTTRYVAVRAKVSELVVIHTNGESDKVKAPSVKVLYECDIDGAALQERGGD